MRRIDELHLEHPFAGSRMLRDEGKGVMDAQRYFMLQVIGADVPDQLAYQAHKGSVWLTPNTKLSGSG